MRSCFEFYSKNDDIIINIAVAACALEKVKLSSCRDLEMDILHDKARCLEAAHNLRQLGSLEECVCRWMRQISLVNQILVRSYN